MALKLILGGSGYGKSHRMYEDLIRESMAHSELNYIIIVPEQYTMQVQKKVVMMHPLGGLLNVDVVSFGRLAYKVFSELHMKEALVLEDIGKSMVLRKVIASMASELTVFKGNIRKQGFVGEMKSTVSELLQYHITPEQLKTLSVSLKNRPMLSGKLHDIGCIYEAFKKDIEQRYITTEEILDRFTAVASQSEILKNSVLYLDEFTGFTPSQYKLIAELLKVSRHMQIALTVDPREKLYEPGAPFRLFYLTKDTIYKLEKLCAREHIEREKDIILKEAERFRKNSELGFMEKNIYRSFTGKTYKEPLKAIRLRAARNPSDEMRAAARTMLSLCRQGVRFREMAVITGDLTVYGHVIEQGLKQAGIPYFIDSKKSVLSNCLVEMIRALLEVIGQDFNYESIFRYLKTDMTPVSAGETDILENYILAAGIRGFSRWQKPFERPYRGMAQGELELVNQIREKVMAWLLPVKEAFSSSDKKAGSYARILLEFLECRNMQERIDERCRWFEAGNELALAKEYSQIYRIVSDILQKVIGVLGEEKMSLKEFSDILDAGFNEAKVGIIPPGIDQVIVGDLKRTRLDSIRVMFFIGVNDGLVPGSIKEGGLINDMDKEILMDYDFEMAPTGKQEACTEQFYIYTMLSKASERLYMSFSKIDEHGKSMRPSVLIGRVMKLFEKLEIEESDQETLQIENIYHHEDAVRYFTEGLRDYKNGQMNHIWQQLYLWFKKHEKDTAQKLCDTAFLSHEDDMLSKSVVRALYGHTLENSVTTLEKYASCAYAHFLTYGLMLKARQEYRIEAPDLGILFHSALELFSKKLQMSAYNWHTVPDDFREKLAGDCVREVAVNYHHTILLDNYRNKFLIYRLVRMVKRTVWALQKQLQAGKFEPEDYELRFEKDSKTGTVDIRLSDDEVLKLKGTIDRLDKYEDDENIYVKIIDYKSGAKKFDLLALYYGLQLQLVVYMDAAMAMKREKSSKKVIPAGILYYHIDDPLIAADSTEETEGIYEAVLKALRMNGLVNEDLEVIRLMDADFEKESAVIPVAFNKDGSLSKKSGTASETQFRALFDYTARTVKKFGQQILNGHIEVNPYKRGNKGNACTYCAYRAVCGFDESVEGYEFRQLMELSAQSVWEEICREVKADGHDMDE